MSEAQPLPGRCRELVLTWPSRNELKEKALGTALGLITFAGAAGLLWRWRSQRARILNRPFALKDLAAGETVEEIFDCYYQ
ncbi:unnamed protein product [Cladocopium goreaui]|uniref:Alpha-amylase type B isozyme n=1 Tax=Cladocopium goreaui TaxID=2562237 RepID=A0A9P1DTJ8_9DINO|nr:unnamed protein product [Cladocopium goreaui]